MCFLACIPRYLWHNCHNCYIYSTRTSCEPAPPQRQVVLETKLVEAAAVSNTSTHWQHCNSGNSNRVNLFWSVACSPAEKLGWSLSFRKIWIVALLQNPYKLGIGRTSNQAQADQQSRRVHLCNRGILRSDSALSPVLIGQIIDATHSWRRYHF